MKNNITIKTTYIGEDKGHLKKGDVMWVMLNKKDTLCGHESGNVVRQLNNLEEISLLTYLRQKIAKISQEGTVFY